MADDNVLPFRRRPPGPTGPAEQPSDAALHRSTRRGQPGARRLAADQAAIERDRYTRAQHRQREAAALATGRPCPARISIALDYGGHEGPEVDLAVGTWERNPAGDVDVWEAGGAAPTGEQVKLLSALTGFPVLFFYEWIKPGPILGRPGQIIICYRRKVNGKRCHVVEQDEVDGNGVLHYSGEPRRTLPKWWTDGQGALF